MASVLESASVDQVVGLGCAGDDREPLVRPDAAGRRGRGEPDAPRNVIRTCWRGRRFTFEERFLIYSFVLAIALAIILFLLETIFPEIKPFFGMPSITT